MQNLSESPYTPCLLIRYKLCSALLNPFHCLPLSLSFVDMIHVFTLEIIPLPQINQSSTIFSRPRTVTPSIFGLSSFPISFKKTEIECYLQSHADVCLNQEQQRNVKNKTKACHASQNEKPRQKAAHALILNKKQLFRRGAADTASSGLLSWPQ